MTNLTWHIEQRVIKDLKPYGKNPRALTKKQHEKLKENIEKFGLIDKPFVNLDNTIIGGHQRLRVMQSIDRDAKDNPIDVWVPNRMLTDKEVEELNYRHNENTAMWDYDILANEYELEDLTSWGTLDLAGEREEKPTKAKPARATLEFETKADLEMWSSAIETAALEWGAKLKVKA